MKLTEKSYLIFTKMVVNLPKHPSNSKRIDIFMFHATGRMRIAVSDIGSGSCCSTWVYFVGISFKNLRKTQ